MIIIGHKDGSIEKASAVRFTQKTKGYSTHTIIGGEFAVGNDIEEIAFKTLLGSCVAIMFYDKVTKIKGMNHFLLPKTNNTNDDMKYGLYSVEAMLNEMYKLGCNKGNMVAKISRGDRGFGSTPRDRMRPQPLTRPRPARTTVNRAGAVAWPPTRQQWRDSCPPTPRSASGRNPRVPADRRTAWGRAAA